MSNVYSRSVHDWLSPVLLRTVWHDRLVFVAAFVVTFAVLSLLRARAAPGQGDLFSEPRSVAWRRIAMAAAWTTIAVIGLSTVYGFATLHAELGFDTFLAALGGVFGCVLAWKILSRLLPGKSDEQPISILAVVSLCVLLIVLNFPVFRFEFALLLNNLNIASLKVPNVLEIGFGQPSEGARRSTVSSGGEQSAATSFQRSSDPRPGLKALDADLRGDALGYMTADRAYIGFLYSVSKRPNEADAAIYDYDIQMIDKAEQQLRPIRALANCLSEYVQAYPDSHILLIDIKPVIATLFDVHAAAKRQNELSRTRNYRQIETAVARWFDDFDKNYIHYQLTTELPACKKRRLVNEAGPDASASSPALTYFDQPYIAIALADLLMTYGAPDAGVQVLAEWLAGSKGKNGSKKERTAWFRLRAESELASLLYTITGPANRSYSRIVRDYDQDIERLLESRGETFADLKRRCTKSISDAPLHQFSIDERNLLNLVAGVRSDLGRSDVYFFSSLDDFLQVDSVYLRAAALADIDNACLPAAVAERKGSPAEWRVTAGLVGVAASDRMSALAGSSRERRRVAEVRDEATKFLAGGVEELAEMRQQIGPKQPDFQEISWDTYSDQIFGTAPWDISISLGKYTLDRLKSLP